MDRAYLLFQAILSTPALRARVDEDAETRLFVIDYARAVDLQCRVLGADLWYRRVLGLLRRAGGLVMAIGIAPTALLFVDSERVYLDTAAARLNTAIRASTLRALDFVDSLLRENSVVTAAVRCKSCGSRTLLILPVQLRKADEATSYIYRCACGEQWTSA